MDTAKEAEPISVEFAKNEDDSKPKIDHFEKGKRLTESHPEKTLISTSS